MEAVQKMQEIKTKLVNCNKLCKIAGHANYCIIVAKEKKRMFHDMGDLIAQLNGPYVQNYLTTSFGTGLSLLVY